MTAPPGRAPTTEPPGERITGERITDLSTKSGQERYLVLELGVTYPQAKTLIRAYERDQSAPIPRSAQKTYRRDFLAWLMRQAPDLPARRKKTLAHDPRKHDWMHS